MILNNVRELDISLIIYEIDRYLTALNDKGTLFMKFIFIDTFALAQLTKDYYNQLDKYLTEHRLYIVITSVQLIEYYSPIVETADRTNRAVQLLTKHPFVIVNQSDIFDQEEEAYPTILKLLPFKLNSDDTLANLIPEARAEVLLQMFHKGIPETGFDIKKWTDAHNSSKMDWPEHASAIIKNAENKALTKSKAEFLHSHDLRFCNKILDAISKLGNKPLQDEEFSKNINKLIAMRDKKDTWKLRGIHLSSLIFWYDYIIAKKKIKPSDEGDLMHAMIFPYCSVVIADNSRIDGINTIQKKENLYEDVRFYKIRDFIKLLTS